MRSFWLCKKANRKRALQCRVERPEGIPPRVEFEVFEPKADQEVHAWTVTRAKATCVCCGAVLPPGRVRTQLAAQRGGADAVFDEEGHRTGGARMTAVVALKPGQTGRHYRLPTDRDYEAVHKAQALVAQILEKWECGGKQGLCPVPDEPTPAGGGSGAGRAFSVQRYGMLQWGDLFTARQKFGLTVLGGWIQGAEGAQSMRELLALALDRIASRSSSLCLWRFQADQEKVEHIFGRQTLSMVWDFAEAVVTSQSTGSFLDGIKIVAGCVEAVSRVSDRAGQVQQADACELPLPTESAAVWFTDPPYYDAIPYSDLSDFFLVWLKRSLPKNLSLQDPHDPTNSLSPKRQEAVQDETRIVNGRPKDRAFFEETISKAFERSRLVLQDAGIGSVVFAHKTTEGWEALLSGMIHGGWTIVGSWPISTEMPNRLRTRESAALAASTHLICRPRPEDAMVGDWADILRELPHRVGNWMERLQGEGVRGADLVFACIGPALQRVRVAPLPDDFLGDLVDRPVLFGEFCLGALQAVGEGGGLVGRADPAAGFGPQLVTRLVQGGPCVRRVPLGARHRQNPPIPTRVVREAPRVVCRAGDHAAAQERGRVAPGGQADVVVRPAAELLDRARTGTAQVDRVIDGDTIRVRLSMGIALPSG